MMPKARTKVDCIEQLVNDGRKRFVRYAEGAALYSLGLHTFQEIAKEADAVYKVKRCILVNVEEIDRYLKQHCKLGIVQKSEIQASITSLETGKLCDMEGCYGK